MNSGVSPLGRDDEKRFNQKARGITDKFAGKANSLLFRLRVDEEHTAKYRRYGNIPSRFECRYG